MNAAVYIFAKYGIRKYCQYPDDGTSAIFEKFLAHANDRQTIAIHREGDLMYYGYIQRLNSDESYDGEYFGVCVVLNGVIVSDIPRKFTYRPQYIFQIFEESIDSMKIDELLSQDDHGNQDIAEICTTYTKIERWLNTLLDKFGKLKFKPLPPKSYKTPDGIIKGFQYNEDWNEIVKSSYTNDYTYISNLRKISQGQEIKAEPTSGQTQTQGQKKDFTDYYALIILTVGAFLLLFAVFYAFH